MKRQKDKENFNVLINHKKTTWAYFKQLLSKRQRNLHNSVLLESSLKIKEDTGSFTLISQTWTFCMRAERGWVRPFPGWSTVGVRWNLCCLQVYSLTLWAKQRAKSHSVHLCSLLPLCHTPLSPTVILSNSLLISSQPSFYLLPLFSSVSVTNIFHFLKVIRRSQLTGVVKAGEGRPSSVSLSLTSFTS